MEWTDWGNFSLYAFLAVAMGVAIVGLSSLLGPKRPKAEKLDPYECGVAPIESARDRFAVHFYLVAIMFMLFDIESVFLIPWAVGYKGSWAQLVEVGVFVGILGFGLLYIIRRRVLHWS